MTAAVFDDLPIAFLLVLAVGSPLFAQDGDRPFFGAVLGGYAGAVTGVVIGLAACDPEDPCAAPIVIGGVAGATLGFLAGVEQPHRVGARLGRAARASARRGDPVEQRQRVFLMLRRGSDGRWRYARGMSNVGPDA